jgi:excisionase family DNA binding protein
MSVKNEKAGPAKAGSKNSAPVSLLHLLTIREVAEITGLKEGTLYLWIAQRKIEVVRLGRSLRVTSEVLAALIAENTVPAREERS